MTLINKKVPAATGLNKVGGSNGFFPAHHARATLTLVHGRNVCRVVRQVGGNVWLANNAATRRAGGRLGAGAAARKQRVVVDVREFMSSLPCVLHQAGLELVPVTLEVGRFIFV